MCAVLSRLFSYWLQRLTCVVFAGHRYVHVSDGDVEYLWCINCGMQRPLERVPDDIAL